MSATARIAAFAAALAGVFALAAIAGAALDPTVEEPKTHLEEEAQMHSKTPESETHDAAHTKPGAADGHSAHPATRDTASGLSIANGNLRLAPEQSNLPAGRAVPYRFRILDRTGAPLTDFERTHERRLHLIVVRRDFSGFQHLHPQPLGDGSWEADIDTSLPGSYRVYADFQTDGAATTLSADLAVAGKFEPQPLPAPASSAMTDGGYEVTLGAADDHGHSGTQALEFEVTRDGEPIAVEPYLGADGHLVALREGDLAYIHTHPEGEPGGSGPIRFAAELPSAGSYRLYLQFKHDGRVETAEFTLEAGDEHAH